MLSNKQNLSSESSIRDNSNSFNANLASTDQTSGNSTYQPKESFTSCHQITQILLELDSLDVKLSNLSDISLLTQQSSISEEDIQEIISELSDITYTAKLQVDSFNVIQREYEDFSIGGDQQLTRNMCMPTTDYSNDNFNVDCQEFQKKFNKIYLQLIEKYMRIFEITNGKQLILQMNLLVQLNRQLNLINHQDKLDNNKIDSILQAQIEYFYESSIQSDQRVQVLDKAKQSMQKLKALLNYIPEISERYDCVLSVLGDFKTQSYTNETNLIELDLNLFMKRNTLNQRSLNQRVCGEFIHGELQSQRDTDINPIQVLKMIKWYIDKKFPQYYKKAWIHYCQKEETKSQSSVLELVDTDTDMTLLISYNDIEARQHSQVMRLYYQLDNRFHRIMMFLDHLRKDNSILMRNLSIDQMLTKSQLECIVLVFLQQHEINVFPNLTRQFTSNPNVTFIEARHLMKESLKNKLNLEFESELLLKFTKLMMQIDSNLLLFNTQTSQILSKKRVTNDPYFEKQHVLSIKREPAIYQNLNVSSREQNQRKRENIFQSRTAPQNITLDSYNPMSSLVILKHYSPLEENEKENSHTLKTMQELQSLDECPNVDKEVEVIFWKRLYQHAQNNVMILDDFMNTHKNEKERV
eukprot:403372894